jgi:hypothetical protein
VFISKGDGIFEPREVHLGVETDRYYEVLLGFEGGEKVVTSAQFLLDSEAKLQEAVQRRLEQRRQIPGRTTTSEEDANNHQGHVH